MALNEASENEILAFRVGISLWELGNAFEDLNAATERAAAAMRSLADEAKRADAELLAGLPELEDDFYAGRNTNGTQDQ